MIVSVNTKRGKSNNVSVSEPYITRVLIFHTFSLQSCFLTYGLGEWGGGVSSILVATDRV
jgi:hypothetical protein